MIRDSGINVILFRMNRAVALDDFPVNKEGIFLCINLAKKRKQIQEQFCNLSVRYMYVCIHILKDSETEIINFAVIQMKR